MLIPWLTHHIKSKTIAPRCLFLEGFSGSILHCFFFMNLWFVLQLSPTPHIGKENDQSFCQCLHLLHQSAQDRLNRLTDRPFSYESSPNRISRNSLLPLPQILFSREWEWYCLYRKEYFCQLPVFSYISPREMDIRLPLGTSGKM